VPKNNLHNSYISKDINLFSELVKYSSNINDIINCHGRTLLAEAIYEEKIDFAILLITNGADLNIPDKYGITPLMYTRGLVRMNEVIFTLISCDARINDLSNAGLSFLLIVAAVNNPKVISVLATLGADLDIKNLEGKSPLIISIENGNIENVFILASNGADINCIDNRLRTPLIYATIRGETRIIEFLLIQNYLDLNYKDEYGYSALTIAVKNNNKEALDLLLNAGCDILNVDKWGRSIILEAILLNDLYAARKLIKFGANVNIADYSGNLPLNHAIEKNNLEAVAILLEAGAFLPKDISGLILVLEYFLEWDDICGYILRENLDELRDYYYDLRFIPEDDNLLHPIFLATVIGNVEIVEHLISIGVPFDASIMLRAAVKSKQERLVSFWVNYNRSDINFKPLGSETSTLDLAYHIKNNRIIDILNSFHEHKVDSDEFDSSLKINI
jgi:ankyrin repeat protein